MKRRTVATAGFRLSSAGLAALHIALVGLVLAGACSSRINSVTIERDSGARRWDVDNIFLSSDIRIMDVKEELKDLLLIPFRFESLGSQIIYYSPPDDS